MVATTQDEVRSLVLVPGAEAGLSVRSVADWAALCGAIAEPSTRVVFVDPELPKLNAALLHGLAVSFDHHPLVRVLGATMPPLRRIPATHRAVLREVRARVGPGGLTAEDRHDLRWWGLTDAPLSRWVGLADSATPILIHGERGTGKERFALMIHRLARTASGDQVSGPAAPFQVLAAGARWDRVAGPGTLYLEAIHRRDAGEVRVLVRDALALQWRVSAASRGGEAVSGVDWERVHLPPLRDRPNDLAALTSHYLGIHARRLGLGRRTVDRAFLAQLLAWRWPGNQRELEQFVLHALAEMPGPVLRGAALPPTVQALLQAPLDAAAQQVGGFAELAEQRLRPVVQSFAPGPGPTLHDLVVGAAERALISLALARTGGNRKAAATLLGLSRNTLADRIHTLNISVSRE